MTLTVLLTAACVAVLTTTAVPVYRSLWTRLRDTSITPTGFGVLLAPALFVAGLAAGASPPMVAAFAVLVVATAIYWYDDLFELSARFRIALSFVAGGAMCGCLLLDGPTLPLPFVAGLVVAAAVLNVVLTNIVNFYDGADLNLATFIAMTALVILFDEPADSVLFACALAALAVVVPFGAFNRIPKTIYLGDAGSFALAGFLTIIAVVYVGRGEVLPQVAFAAALPALDTAYVFCIRIIQRHDLMTRNYLHLYQKLQQRFPPFWYLAPQIVNVAMLLVVSGLLKAAGLSDFASVAIASVVVTVPFYFLCRRFLLGESWSGPSA